MPEATHATAIAMLPVAAITESPTNPRRTFGDLTELVESVRSKGILQPILVRPQPDGAEGYELVFGARRLRAARAVGMEQVPAMVRELSDLEVIEAQVIENAQREDVHPLEEADGFRQLLERHRYPVDEIAARVGKSKAYVYARLKLCSLGDAGRKAFAEGTLHPTVALYLARIPDAKLQEKATDEVTAPRYDGELMSVKAAFDHIQRHYMLRLADAPFKVDLKDLILGVCSCAECPHRTGNQGELFADVASEDICTNPVCYRAKVDATWDLRKLEAERKGRQVLDGKDAKGVFSSYGNALAYGAAYVELEDACDQDPDGRTWKKLLGKQAAELVVLARDESGRARQLLPKKAVAEALQAAGHDFAKKVDPSEVDAEWKKKQEKERQEREVRVHAAVSAIGECVDRAERGHSFRQVWKLVAELLLSPGNFSDLGMETAERRGLIPNADDTDDRDTDGPKYLLERLPNMSDEEARGLVLELALENAEAYRGWDGQGALKRACEVMGVDLTEAEAQAKKRAKESAKASAKPKAKGKKRGTAPEVCAECGKADPKGDYYGGLCTACDDADPQPEGSEEPKAKGAKKANAKKTAAAEVSP